MGDLVGGTMMKDVVIIGAGPAGLTAAMYSGRAKLTTLVLDKMGPGGQAATTHHIDNYPGFPEGISGLDLAAKLEKHATRFGAELEYGEVIGVEQVPGGFAVLTQDNKYPARSIIIASGTREKPLGVPGEKEFRGRGVSYCATCDGAFYEGKNVAVVGGGDSALIEALFMTRYASKVYIIHRRDQLRAVKSLQDKAFSEPKIEFVLSSIVDKINGAETVKSLSVKHVKSGRITDVTVDGLFIYVGLVPNTEFLKGFVGLDPMGYVMTSDELDTSVKGVFACGDVRKKTLRQVSTAVGDGALASTMVERYLT